MTLTKQEEVILVFLIFFRCLLRGCTHLSPLKFYYTEFVRFYHSQRDSVHGFVKKKKTSSVKSFIFPLGHMPIIFLELQSWNGTCQK